MQDVKTLKLTPNAAYHRGKSDGLTDRAQFICPINLKEMNGSQPFVFLWACGCVFSQAGLRAVSSTPPPKEESGKSEDTNAKDTDATGPGLQLDICPQCAAKYNRAEDVLLLNPSEEQLIDIIAAMYKRRASQLAKVKRRKRKANMSDAVRSLYGPVTRMASRRNRLS